VSVVSFAGRGHYPKGVKQYCVGLKDRGPRWVEMKLRYLFWRIRPDIVHVHWAHFAVPVRNAWRGRLAVTVWGTDVYKPDNFSDTQWREMRHSVSQADLVTCDSQDLKRTITGTLGVPPSKVEVVQWGVDTDAFAPVGPNMRQALGLGTRDVVFSVRNFTPLYNQETVVEAFSRLRSQRPNAFLLMKNYGGDPDYVSRIRADIRAKGIEEHSRIVESIAYEQMPDLYRTADVTISIPYSDATPMSLLESMACGPIPICSDLPSLREWITDGENGFLVSADNPDAIATRILWALDGSPIIATFATRNRLMVEQRASQHVHMRRMGQMYDSLIKTAQVTYSGN